MINQNQAQTAQAFSATNFKLYLNVQLQCELDAWQAGERAWNVSNQFDESVLESALENLDTAFDASIADLNPQQCHNLSVMAWAHRLSNFTPPELDRAWVD